VPQLRKYNQIRIFQATDWYPPPLTGGRDLHVRMLAHELVARGHEVEVITLARSGAAGTEMDGDIPVHRIDGWNRLLNRFYEHPERPFHPPVPDPGVVHSLVNLIQERRPDVVHAHSWILHSLLHFLPSQRTRLVFTMHDYGVICPKFTFVHKGGVCGGPEFVKCVVCASEQYGAIPSAALTSGLIITRRSRRRVDRYIAVSTPVARACASVSVGSNIEVIPPFVSDDSLRRNDAIRPAFLPAEGDFVMFAGALGPHKGIDVLLEAWQGLDSAIPLVLVGLRRHDTPREFPKGVIVAEDVPHGDVLDAWMHCAVAIVPSIWPDPHPLVAIEAMAAGRPVIASAIGGLTDIVEDGVTGVLVPPGDALTLRTSIAQILADPQQRVAMGLAARERAARYSAAIVVPQIERVYREVVANPPPRS
jgi:glycosyltransferase involved in cell wall biosynthesis